MNNNTIHTMSRNMLLSLAALTIFLSSCTKDVDNIKLPATDPKLVVGCFISPEDTLIVVTLTRSNPIFGAGHNNTNNSSVEDAVVTISNGTTSATIPYNYADQEYELSASSFPILGGQTYYLSVSTPRGESVSGSCTVPASNLSALSVEFTDTVSSTKVITVKWQDMTGEANYYRAFGQTVFIDLFSPGDTSYNDMYGDNTLQNDYQKDGNEMRVKLNGFQNPSYNTGESWKVVAYDIYLLNVDAEYYKYQNSHDHYVYDDPFSEPSPLYTNIQGGLGVFGAYRKLHVRVP